MRGMILTALVVLFPVAAVAADLPVEISAVNDDLHFKAAKQVPPFGSKVWVILTPVPEKEKKDEKK